MGRPLKQILAIAILVPYTATQVVLSHALETNIWADRRKAMQSQTASASPSKPASNQYAALPANLPPIRSALNAAPQWSARNEQRFGRVSSDLQALAHLVAPNQGDIQDIHDAGNAKEAPVLLLQDIHMNPEAQGNLAGILQNAINEDKVGVVGVEGAFAQFDFKPFRSIQNQNVMRDVAKAFLDGNELAASSYAGIASVKEPPMFIGIDDRAHYDANVQAFLTTRSSKKKVKQQISDEKRALQEKKSKTFSPALKRFDDLKEAYEAGSVSLGEYMTALSVIARGDSQRRSNLTNFLEAYRLEKSLNFQTVERERRRVVEQLTPKLSPAEIESFVNESLAYRMGRIGFGVYYQGFKNLCDRKGIALSNTPAFADYIRYVMLADGIKANALFAELRQQEEAIALSLITSADERALMQQSEHVLLADKLVEFALTPDEWERYKVLSGQFSVLSENLRTNELRTENFERFYKEADARSHLMVAKLLRTNELRTENSKAAKVLVVGGFHTPEITQLLRDKKISYVVASPKITKIEGEGSEYLSVFAREKTPLEKLFQGDKLFLAPRKMTTEDPAKFFRLMAVGEGLATGDRTPDIVMADGTVVGAKLSSLNATHPLDVAVSVSMASQVGINAGKFAHSMADMGNTLVGDGVPGGPENSPSLAPGKDNILKLGNVKFVVTVDQETGLTITGAGVSVNYSVDDMSGMSAMEDDITLGRDDSNTIRIGDGSVSRKHAAFIVRSSFAFGKLLISISLRNYSETRVTLWNSQVVGSDSSTEIANFVLSLDDLMKAKPVAGKKAEPVAAPAPAKAVPEDRFEIGKVVWDHGHRINGGRSIGQSGGQREYIVVDYDNDVRFQKFVRNIIDIASDGGKVNLKAPGNKDVLPKLVYDAVFKAIEYNVEHANFLADNFTNQDVLIGDIIYDRKGVCRHQGLICAAVLEQLILQGYLTGQVYYGRRPGHGWAFYRTSAGEWVVFDVAQGHFGNPSQYFHGNGGLFLYSLNLPPVLADLRPDNPGDTVIYAGALRPLDSDQLLQSIIVPHRQKPGFSPISSDRDIRAVGRILANIAASPSHLYYKNIQVRGSHSVGNYRILFDGRIVFSLFAEGVYVVGPEIRGVDHAIGRVLLEIDGKWVYLREPKGGTASSFDPFLKASGFDKKHPILYGLYTTLIAGAWETYAFQAWLNSSSDAWSVLTVAALFTAAHFIVKWLVRAALVSWKMKTAKAFGPALWQAIKRDMTLNSALRAVSLFFLSILFSLPFLGLSWMPPLVNENPFIAAALTHAIYNALVLYTPLGRYVPVASIVATRPATNATGAATPIDQLRALNIPQVNDAYQAARRRFESTESWELSTAAIAIVRQYSDNNYRELMGNIASHMTGMVTALNGARGNPVELQRLIEGSRLSESIYEYLILQEANREDAINDTWIAMFCKTVAVGVIAWFMGGLDWTWLTGNHEAGLKLARGATFLMFTPWEWNPWSLVTNLWKAPDAETVVQRQLDKITRVETAADYRVAGKFAAEIRRLDGLDRDDAGREKWSKNRLVAIQMAETLLSYRSEGASIMPAFLKAAEVLSPEELKRRIDFLFAETGRIRLGGQSPVEFFNYALSIGLDPNSAHSAYQEKIRRFADHAIALKNNEKPRMSYEFMSVAPELLQVANNDDGVAERLWPVAEDVLLLGTSKNESNYCLSLLNVFARRIPAGNAQERAATFTANMKSLVTLRKEITDGWGARTVHFLTQAIQTGIIDVGNPDDRAFMQAIAPFCGRYGHQSLLKIFADKSPVTVALLKTNLAPHFKNDAAGRFNGVLERLEEPLLRFILRLPPEELEPWLDNASFLAEMLVGVRKLRWVLGEFNNDAGGILKTFTMVLKSGTRMYGVDFERFCSLASAWGENRTTMQSIHHFLLRGEVFRMRIKLMRKMNDLFGIVEFAESHEDMAHLTRWAAQQVNQIFEQEVPTEEKMEKTRSSLLLAFVRAMIGGNIEEGREIYRFENDPEGLQYFMGLLLLYKSVGESEEPQFKEDDEFRGEVQERIRQLIQIVLLGPQDKEENRRAVRRHVFRLPGNQEEIGRLIGLGYHPVLFKEGIYAQFEADGKRYVGIISKSPLEEAAIGLNPLSECFTTDGAHLEAPVVHATEVNSFVARLYEVNGAGRLGNQVANTVVVLGDEGAYPFSSYPKANPNYEMAWAELWKALSYASPDVLLDEKSAGYEVFKGKHRKFNGTIHKPATVWERATYYDAPAATNHNGEFTHTIANGARLNFKEFPDVKLGIANRQNIADGSMGDFGPKKDSAHNSKSNISSDKMAQLVSAIFALKFTDIEFGKLLRYLSLLYPRFELDAIKKLLEPKDKAKGIKDLDTKAKAIQKVLLEKTEGSRVTASTADPLLKLSGFDKKHPILYGLYTTIIAGGWETDAFQAWLNSSSDAWSVLIVAAVFTAAHFIVKWLVRAVLVSWRMKAANEFGPALWRAIKRDMTFKAVGRAAALFALSILFSLPFLGLSQMPSVINENPFVAAVLTHAIYNALVLYTPLGRYLPAASIAGEITSGDELEANVQDLMSVDNSIRGKATKNLQVFFQKRELAKNEFLLQIRNVTRAYIGEQLNRGWNRIVVSYPDTDIVRPAGEPMPMRDVRLEGVGHEGELVVSEEDLDYILEHPERLRIENDVKMAPLLKRIRQWQLGIIPFYLDFRSEVDLNLQRADVVKDAARSRKAFSDYEAVWTDYESSLIKKIRGNDDDQPVSVPEVMSLERMFDIAHVGPIVINQLLVAHGAIVDLLLDLEKSNRIQDALQRQALGNVIRRVLVTSTPYSGQLDELFSGQLNKYFLDLRKGRPSVAPNRIDQIGWAAYDAAIGEKIRTIHDIWEKIPGMTGGAQKEAQLHAFDLINEVDDLLKPHNQKLAMPTARRSFLLVSRRNMVVDEEDDNPAPVEKSKNEALLDEVKSAFTNFVTANGADALSRPQRSEDGNLLPWITIAKRITDAHAGDADVTPELLGRVVNAVHAINYYYTAEETELPLGYLAGQTTLDGAVALFNSVRDVNGGLSMFKRAFPDSIIPTSVEIPQFAQHRSGFNEFKRRFLEPRSASDDAYGWIVNDFSRMIYYVNESDRVALCGELIRKVDRLKEHGLNRYTFEQLYNVVRVIIENRLRLSDGLDVDTLDRIESFIEPMISSIRGLSRDEVRKSLELAADLQILAGKTNMDYPLLPVPFPVKLFDGVLAVVKEKEGGFIHAIEDIAKKRGARKEHLELATSHTDGKRVAIEFQNTEEMAKLHGTAIYNAVFVEPNLMELLTYLSFLRVLFSYRTHRDRKMPPLKFGIKNGYAFPLGGNLYALPTTQSFRRWLIVEWDGKSANVNRVVEIKIPGAMRNKGSIQAESFTVADDVSRVNPEIIESPIAQITVERTPEMYAGSRRASKGAESISVLNCRRDASRLTQADIPPELVDDVFAQATHVVRVFMQEHKYDLGADGHPENYRIDFNDDRTKATVTSAGDTEDYSKKDTPPTDESHYIGPLRELLYPNEASVSAEAAVKAVKEGADVAFAVPSLWLRIVAGLAMAIYWVGVASLWETRVFQVWGMKALPEILTGWGAPASLSTAAGIVFVTVVFSAAHFIVRWIARTKHDGFRGFAIRAVLGLLFTAPLLWNASTDQIIAVHALYNATALILRLFPKTHDFADKWMPLASLIPMPRFTKKMYERAVWLSVAIYWALRPGLADVARARFLKEFEARKAGPLRDMEGLRAELARHFRALNTSNLLSESEIDRLVPTLADMFVSGYTVYAWKDDVRVMLMSGSGRLIIHTSLAAILDGIVLNPSLKKRLLINAVWEQLVQVHGLEIDLSIKSAQMQSRLAKDRFMKEITAPYGTRLDYKSGSVLKIHLIVEMLKLLPPAMLRQLRERIKEIKVGSGSLFGQMNDGILSTADRVFTTRAFMDLFLHELGHAFQVPHINPSRNYGDGNILELDRMFGEIIELNGIYAIPGIESTAAQRQNYVVQNTEMFAETFMHYLLNRETFRNGFRGFVPNTDGKTADQMEEIYAKWKKIFEYYDTKVFGNSSDNGPDNNGPRPDNAPDGDGSPQLADLVPAQPVGLADFGRAKGDGSTLLIIKGKDWKKENLEMEQLRVMSALAKVAGTSNRIVMDKAATPVVREALRELRRLKLLGLSFKGATILTDKEMMPEAINKLVTTKLKPSKLVASRSVGIIGERISILEEFVPISERMLRMGIMLRAVLSAA